MTEPTAADHIVEFRRELHRYPEPAWREFYTTSRIVDECERIGVDSLHVGRHALVSEHRTGVPEAEELERWHQRAREAGAREDVLEATAGGHTGVVAELHRGDGPTIALRVDIDALPQAEADDEGHQPAREGFRSENEGAMHACGHDGHASIGIGVLEAIAESDFDGTLKVFFQPAEELIGGGEAMAKSGHLDDVDALLALHLGLDHPTGEVVAGVDGFLAVKHLEATFSGESAHAGGHPEEGRNAILALATATQNLYAIPRHDDGPSRVNVGQIAGGTASNIVAAEAHLVGEVRGETTELKDYMFEHASRIVENAAGMHDCEVSFDPGGEAPSATSDDDLRDLVAEVAGETDVIESILDRDELGGSEDATYLMQEVQDSGGVASYVAVGTDHPGGHHTAYFDLDERSLVIGVDLIAETVRRFERN
ncbi:MAG: aminobenzoyl-glutamate utilization protein A [Halobacteriales archaeon]|jgi:aminobenzoyl-glutamate utilization protein A